MRMVRNKMTGGQVSDLSSKRWLLLFASWSLRRKAGQPHIDDGQSSCVLLEPLLL